MEDSRMPRPRGFLLLPLVVLSGPARAAEPPAPARVAIDVEVSGLAPGVATVVRHAVDLDAIREAAGPRGVVDENTIRLAGRADAGAPGAGVPVQYTPAAASRPAARTLLPGTRPEISLAAEFPAADPPAGARARGTLTWLAHGDAAGRARYVLTFAVARAGRAVVVPYPPYNVRVFDDRGRIASRPDFARMQVRPPWPRDGRLQVFDGPDAVLGIHLGPSPEAARAGHPAVRRPYFDPVIGPDGQPATSTGKPHDPTGSHAHHDGLWIAHHRVDDRSFWSNTGGVIAHEGIDATEDGPVFAQVAFRTQWWEGGVLRLKERRTVTVYRGGPDARLLDLTLTLSPADDRPVTLGRTSFGFLAARVPASRSVFDGGGAIVNAIGGVNERGVHLERAGWLDLSGPVATGASGGLALLDHPGNPGYPTVWHARDDGWAGAAVSGAGDVTIPAGDGLTLNYRVVLHRGDGESGRVAAHHAAFAARPAVTLGPPRVP
jgi:hypothetical protein